MTPGPGFPTTRGAPHGSSGDTAAVTSAGVRSDRARAITVPPTEVRSCAITAVVAPAMPTGGSSQIGISAGATSDPPSFARTPKGSASPRPSRARRSAPVCRRRAPPMSCAIASRSEISSAVSQAGAATLARRRTPRRPPLAPPTIATRRPDRPTIEPCRLALPTTGRHTRHRDRDPRHHRDPRTIVRARRHRAPRTIDPRPTRRRRARPTIARAHRRRPPRTTAPRHPPRRPDRPTIVQARRRALPTIVRARRRRALRPLRHRPDRPHPPIGHRHHRRDRGHHRRATAVVLRRAAVADADMASEHLAPPMTASPKASEIAR
jgi:hypothetical protein